jgi:Arc/MetJ-type ribon-helix-helix transcriptional regulator
MSKMITLRITEERLAQLDQLVASGEYRSRAAALTTALDRLLAEERERAIDSAIVDGYTRIPPTADEDASARAAGIRSLRDESW